MAGVFAFRGTQPWSLSDWLIDFNYDKEPVEWWQPPPAAAPSAHVSEVPNGIHNSEECEACGPQARSLGKSLYKKCPNFKNPVVVHKPQCEVQACTLHAGP